MQDQPTKKRATWIQNIFFFLHTKTRALKEYTQTQKTNGLEDA